MCNCCSKKRFYILTNSKICASSSWRTRFWNLPDTQCNKPMFYQAPTVSLKRCIILSGVCLRATYDPFGFSTKSDQDNLIRADSCNYPKHCQRAGKGLVQLNFCPVNPRKARNPWVEWVSLRQPVWHLVFLLVLVWRDTVWCKQCSEGNAWQKLCCPIVFFKTILTPFLGPNTKGIMFQF